MKQRLIYTLSSVFMLLLVTSQATIAQTLSGYFTENDSIPHPLEAVTVKLFDNIHNLIVATTTNSLGYFEVKIPAPIKNKNCILHAELTGYETYEIALRLSSEDMNIGTHQLQTKTEELAGVTVTAKHKMKYNGYLLFPSKNIKSKSTSGFDFIKKNDYSRNSYR